MKKTETESERARERRGGGSVDRSLSVIDYPPAASSSSRRHTMCAGDTLFQQHI